MARNMARVLGRGGTKSTGSLSSIKSSLKEAASAIRSANVSGEVKKALTHAQSELDTVDMTQIKSELDGVRGDLDIGKALADTGIESEISKFKLDTGTDSGDLTDGLKSLDIMGEFNKSGLGSLKVGLAGNTDFVNSSFKDIQDKASEVSGAFSFKDDKINELISGAKDKLGEFKGAIDINKELDKFLKTMPTNDEFKSVTDLSSITSNLPNTDDLVDAIEKIDVDSLLGGIDISE